MVQTTASVHLKIGGCDVIDDCIFLFYVLIRLTYEAVNMGTSSFGKHPAVTIEYCL